MSMSPSVLLQHTMPCQAEAVDRAEADIRAINSSVHIIRTSRCEVELSLLLNRQVRTTLR
jgi:G3E family GTPase